MDMKLWISYNFHVISSYHSSLIFSTTYKCKKLFLIQVIQKEPLAWLVVWALFNIGTLGSRVQNSSSSLCIRFYRMTGLSWLLSVQVTAVTLLFNYPKMTFFLQILSLLFQKHSWNFLNSLNLVENLNYVWLKVWSWGEFITRPN